MEKGETERLRETKRETQRLRLAKTSKFDGCGDKCFDTKIPVADPMIFVPVFLCH